MDIKLVRRSGVPQSEIKAHQEIQRAFSASPFSRNWRGFASFKLVRERPGSGDEDFDLVLVTHSSIIVIELKNWRGKMLTQVGNSWYVDGEDRGESPVRLAAEKARRLGTRMSKRLGRQNTTFIQSLVVVSGIGEFDLSEDDARSVLYLQELLEWAKPSVYDAWVTKPTPFNVLSKLRLYDGFFGGKDVRPRDYLIEGFQPGATPTWTHPKGLYAEYRARAKDDPEQLALLRRWNFDSLGTQLIGEGDRAFLGLREQRVYEYVEERNSELQTALLRPISRKDANDVTMDFAELFSLPSRLVRLTEFVNGILPKLDAAERVRLVKALLSRFADLHDLRVAHRDVGDHNLWVERPAQIVISGFPAAYFPSLGTVGKFREEVRVERSRLPEDMGAAKEHTPYSRDVFLLAVTCYQLLFGELPPKVGDVYQWAKRAEDPHEGAFDVVLSTALSREPTERYADAREMLNAVNASTSREKTDIVELSRFSAFRAMTKANDYVETESIVDDDDLQFYRSTSAEQDVAVKVWFGTEPDTVRQDLSIRLLSFLERARTLRGCALGGLPRIVDFGLTRRSLLLVRDWVDGIDLKQWLAGDPPLAARLALAGALSDAIARLHALELPHGDVHPGNVVVDHNGLPVLIDALDFARVPGEAHTPAYLPPEFKTMGPFERDRYGLAAVVAEILGASQSEPVGPFPLPKVHEALRLLLTDRQASALEPLQHALDNAVKAPSLKPASFAIRVPGLASRGVAEGPLHLDNGVLHLRLMQSTRRSNVVVFRLTGVGRQLTVEWDATEEQGVYVAASSVTQSMLFRLQLERDAAVAVDIHLADGSVSDVSELVEFLLANVQVAARYQRLVTAQAVKALPAAATGIQGLRADASVPENREANSNTLGPETVDESSDADTLLPAPISDVWSALLDAEEDALPTLTVADTHRPNPSVRYQVLVPCHMDSEVIDFADKETVFVENLGGDKLWHRCGRLSLRDTSFGDFTELAIDGLSMKATLRIGEKLRLRGKMEKSSFTRRAMAVDRILNGRAVVPNLLNYFAAGRGEVMQPTKYPIPSDNDLEQYSEGNKKLNESQRDAFRKVLSNGPISLVQGPPGTGKTWFIASLLHYLMTKEQARRILLVSQSHEAVNNALEKSLELCRSKGLDFNAVRLGPEASASDSIRHLHESSIEQSYREQFKAEREDRVVELARVMGLPATFARAFVSLQGQLGRLVGRIQKLTDDLGDARTASERQSLSGRLRGLLETFQVICLDVYHVASEADPKETLEIIEKQLLETHEIYATDAVERLRKLVRLSDDWQSALGSPHANFSEFLAKSRTVVAGTLVGIGHRAGGVVQNLYDWVIIDEAGRAAPSELAVAMQTGQRILLVGDHKQLPPTFSRDVQQTIMHRFKVKEDSMVFGSDFERIYESAYGRSVGASLSVQYRMAPDIGELVSRCFYTRLDTGRGSPPSYYAMLPAYMSQQVTWVDTSALPSAVERCSAEKEEFWNDGEARVVMEVLRHIVESDDFMKKIREDLQPGEPAIGIICMYSKQRDVLDNLKSKASWLGDARRLVKIDTVDSYQGKENRIIILSTVRTDRPGFLRKPNRINVGLSRAMERLFIVGATRLWTGRNASLPLGRVLERVKTMQQEGRAAILSANEVLQ